MNTRYTFFLMMGLIGSVTSLSADDTEWLSNEKRSLIQEQLNQYEAEHAKLRTNWISPLNLSGTYSYDKSAASDLRSNQVSAGASISQDIFRSGGIEYQIAYADANYEGETLSVRRDIASLNQTLYLALLNYRKNRYELEQSDLKLKNEDITIYIKRQLYEAGKTDITELNNALMDKSTELKNHSTYRYNLALQRYEITKVSDIDPETFQLPEFTLIARESYLEGNFDLRYSRAQSRVYSTQYDVTRTNYLPSIALNASTGYTNYDQINGSSRYDGGYYSGGLTLTIPLTYNASDTIAEAKAAHLRQVADTADQERQAKASYAQSLELIQSYRDYIDITRENLALYEDLITATKAGFDAGSKTGYDLQTIQNSKAIEELTLKINEINIQIELAKLHFAANTTKEMQ